MVVRRLVADIIIRAPDGHVVAAVEVKNRIGLTPEIAAEFRRNLIEYSALGAAPYFLLVSQDAGYLWRQSTDLSDLAPPDVSFDMARIVARYAGELAEGSRLRNFQVQIVVYRWLLDLADGLDDADPQVSAALASMGFTQAIQGGMIELDATGDSLR